MEVSIFSKLNRILELEKTIRKPTKVSSPYPRCSEDQIEEAETVGFSWTVEDIMNSSDVNPEMNSFSQNPAAVELMASCYFSPSDLYSSFCPLTVGGNDEINETTPLNYRDLLEIQNKAWGKQKVVEGITAARAEKYETAIELCKAALSFVPYSVDAYVCRGASYANLNKKEKAIKDFERALEMDPLNKNATQYLMKIKDNPTKYPTSTILPVEAVETRKPEWRVIPSKVQLPPSVRDLIVKLGSTSQTGSTVTGPQGNIVTAPETFNGYSLEPEEPRSDSSSESESSRNSSPKKRKREKEGKVKKSSKKDDKKKKSRKHREKKKAKKEKKS